MLFRNIDINVKSIKNSKKIINPKFRKHTPRDAKLNKQTNKQKQRISTVLILYLILISIPFTFH